MAATAPVSLLAREIGKTGPFASPEEEAYLNLLRSTSLIAREFERLFQQFGLSEPLYNALRIAAGHGSAGVPTQTIGKQLVAHDPDVTRLVDRLEKAGLVQRERCEKDRRVVFVKITAAGRSKLKSVEAPGNALLKQLLGHVGKARLGELISLLEEVRKPHLPAEVLGPTEPKAK
jgi:DNA-binding MarR family transcriptional regulator